MAEVSLPIGGRSYVNEDLRVPGALPRVAAAMRLLHSGPRFSTDFDMFVRQPTYLRAWLDGIRGTARGRGRGRCVGLESETGAAA